MNVTLTAKEAIRSIVASDLGPMLKSSGFRKSGLTFTRRRGSTGHFLQIQLSSWNRGSVGSFYVNVGVMFDHMRLADDDPPMHPGYDDCQFMVRLERLDPTAPSQWPVDAETSVPEVAKNLADCLKGVVEALNGVSSLADFEGTGWVKSIPWGFPAEYAYAMGRDDEAESLVERQVECFSDRGVTRESVLRGYGFTRLQR